MQIFAKILTKRQLFTKTMSSHYPWHVQTALAKIFSMQINIVFISFQTVVVATTAATRCSTPEVRLSVDG
jgi:hypothetical protein